MRASMLHPTVAGLHRTLASLALAALTAVTPLAAYDNDRYERGPGYGRDRRGDPVSYAIRDLQQIASRSYVDRHESNHFHHAIGDLVRFQERWREGRFDRGRLDNAIGNIEHLVQARQVHPRDRDRLRSIMYDLENLRRGGNRW